MSPKSNHPGAADQCFAVRSHLLEVEAAQAFFVRNELQGLQEVWPEGHALPYLGIWHGALGNFVVGAIPRCRGDIY